MASESLRADEPRLQDVLDALEDPDCRTLLAHMEEPMTADELAEASSIPRSTTYRKLSLLSDAALVEEHVDIRTDGKHATRYDVAFDEVRIVLDDDHSIDVELETETATPDERLSDIWSEVRRET